MEFKDEKQRLNFTKSRKKSKSKGLQNPPEYAFKLPPVFVIISIQFCAMVLSKKQEVFERKRLQMGLLSEINVSGRLLAPLN